MSNHKPVMQHEQPKPFRDIPVMYTGSPLGGPVIFQVLIPENKMREIAYRAIMQHCSVSTTKLDAAMAEIDCGIHLYTYGEDE